MRYLTRQLVIRNRVRCWNGGLEGLLIRLCGIEYIYYLPHLYIYRQFLLLNSLNIQTKISSDQLQLFKFNFWNSYSLDTVKMPCLETLPAAICSIFFFVSGITAFVRKHSQKSLIPASVLAGAFSGMFTNSYVSLASVYVMVIKPHNYIGFIIAVFTSLIALVLGSVMLFFSQDRTVRLQYSSYLNLNFTYDLFYYNTLI